MTFLQAINRVLVGLREGDNQIDESATSLTDAYNLFLAELVNDYIEEVESAHEWWVLHQQGTETYTAAATSEEIDVITGVTPDARVARAPCQQTGEDVPLVFDVTDSEEKYRLYEMPLRTLVRLQATRTNDSPLPTHFALDPQGDGTMDIRLWPVPDNTRSIELHLIVPQGRFDPTDGTDLATTIKVPARLVTLGSIAYALAERGEELGVNPDKAEERYRIAVTDEISREDAQTGGQRYDILVS